MAEQIEDDIVVRGDGNVRMLKFDGYLGAGVGVTGDDEVTFLFQTPEGTYDLSMTKAEAEGLAQRLKAALK